MIMIAENGRMRTAKVSFVLVLCAVFMLLVWSGRAEGVWKVELVDANCTRAVGGTRFVLEDDGSPHLVSSRYDRHNNYCYRDDQQVWHSIPIPLEVYNPIGIHRDLAGEISIVYMVPGGVLYAISSGGVWDQEVITTGYVVSYSRHSYAVNSLGQPHIVLSQDELFTRTKLFCEAESPYGGSWLVAALLGNCETVDLGVDHQDPGIVFDPCDVPYVVHVEDHLDYHDPLLEWHTYLHCSRYEDGWCSTSTDLKSGWSVIDLVLNSQGLHVLCAENLSGYSSYQLLTYNEEVWSVIDGPNDVSVPPGARLVFEPSGNPSIVTWSRDYYYDGSAWHMRAKASSLTGALGVTYTYLKNFQPYLSMNTFGNPCASVSLPEGLYYCEFIPDANTPVRVEIEGLEEAPEKESTSYKAVLLYDDYSVRDVTSLGNWTVESEGYATIGNSGVLTTYNVVKSQSAVVSFECTEGDVLFSAEKRIWIVPVHPKGDLDGDGAVDLKDYSILAGNWLAGVGD